MDPTHLVSPPRAHPSGKATNSDNPHKQPNIVHETWFLCLVIAMLVAIVFSVAAAMLFFRRRHQLTKELGHLSGKCDIFIAFEK